MKKKKKKKKIKKVFNFIDRIIFDGYYLNGEWNGNGKEYSKHGQLEFEGEFLNGKRWNGKGKEYTDDCTKLKFEGIYLNGEKSGMCKTYYDLGKLKSEGEILNGKKNGIYKEYAFYGYIIFQAEFVNGECVRVIK